MGEEKKGVKVCDGGRDKGAWRYVRQWPGQAQVVVAAAEEVVLVVVVVLRVVLVLEVVVVVFLVVVEEEVAPSTLHLPETQAHGSEQSSSVVQDAPRQWPAQAQVTVLVVAAEEVVLVVVVVVALEVVVLLEDEEPPPMRAMSLLPSASIEVSKADQLVAPQLAPLAPGTASVPGKAM